MHDSSLSREILPEHLPKPPKPPETSRESAPAADREIVEPRVPGTSGDETIISDRPPLGTPGHALTGGGAQHIGLALEGQQLVHFHLERFIGGGGMGVVFRAFDTQLERTVAVKVLTHRYGSDEETVRRFNVEAQSAARLNHENIARVHFVGEDKGWNFIVFEFIDGDNLRDIVAGHGPLSIEKTIDYAMQLADALEHASLRDVVHRDIKPSNVLITPEGRAKLVDMGLARLHQVETGEDDLTASGMTLGTFDYISPEQGRDPRNADVRSDLYSLGCTLYYTLTGRPPFPDGTVLQKLLSHTSDPPPDPTLWRRETPPELAAIVLRLLAKLPSERYQRPAELIADLAVLAEKLEIRLPVGTTAWTPLPVATRVSASRYVPWAVPVLLLVGTVAGLPWILPTADLPSAGGPDLRVLRPPAAGLPNPVTATTSRQDTTTGDDLTTPRDTTRPDEDRGPFSRNPSQTPAPALEFPDVQPLPNTLADAPPEPESGKVTATAARTGFFDAASPPREFADAPPDADPDTPVAASWTPRNQASGPASSLPQPSAAVQVLRVGAAQQIPSSAGEQASFQLVSSLDEALSKVRELPNLQRVEICDNGPHRLRPATLANLDLTICGAPGSRPVIQLLPAGNDSADARLSILKIVGGRVRFENLHFELNLETLRARPVSLFSVEAAELVALNKCWVTVAAATSESALAGDATVFNIAETSASRTVLDEFDEVARSPIQIDLRDCVVRGEAQVVRMAAARPLRFTWLNGFLATTSRLVSLGGGSAPPRDGEQISVDLDHVTAIIDKGLLRFSLSSRAEFLYPVDVNCTRSILVSPAQVPLVEFAAAEHSLAELDAHLFFSGQHNFYEGSEVFWLKAVPASMLGAVPLEQRLLFEDWQKRWESAESLARRNQVRWQSPPDKSIPRHAQTPGDFLLDPAPNNPARQAAGGLQRHDAGFRRDELPQWPAAE